MADYLFGSARIRALESNLIGREKIERLLLAKNTDEAWHILREYGIEPEWNEESETFQREETLLSLLREAYDTVCSMLPDDKGMSIWRYPYDCNNIKAAIKGLERKKDLRSMMFDFGTVSVKDVLRMAETGSFNGLPAAMCTAAEEAVSVYAKTRDPQKIDLLLDRACYRDMLAGAQASGVAFIIQLVRQKIDLTNLMICVRILRMQSGELGKIFWQESFLEGGFLSRTLLTEWFNAGEETLWSRLYYSEYSKLAVAVSDTDRSLTVLERSADNFWMESIKAAKFIPYGAEVPVAYLLATEYAVRNLRIVLAGKEAGLNTETVRERIRESYV